MLISRQEAAQRLGISTVTLYRHIQNGRIVSLKIGKFVRFREADLERFIKQCERKPKRDALARDENLKTQRTSATGLSI
jgi:excisionase family DNA binding protein